MNIEQNIELNEGEIYVGRINDEHIVLLPGDNDEDTHEAQLEWAKSIGGDLPNRIEQAMLWANHRDQFKKDWYWSNEIYQAKSGLAWYQYFDYGNQEYNYRYADAMLAAREAGKPEKKTDDGWIEWNGGECPVDPGTRVCVKLRVGRYMDADSWVYRWDHVGGDGDIIAYRGVQL